MKSKPIYIIFMVLLFSIMGNAQEADSSDYIVINESQNTPRTYLPIMIYSCLTMRSGAENIITIHKWLASAEDHLVGIRWFSESGVLGKTGGISSRLGKFILIDLPVDYFSIVLAHEYFGHGARYRELNMDNIHYGFDIPPPYGPGGGEASNYGNVSISTHELLAIWIGGVEVHSIINRKLGLDWMTTNKIHYREASQYFWSFQIMMKYIQDTYEDLADGTKDNDPRAYVRILNANAGYHDLQNLKMSVKDLKSKMQINAANPFVFYSIYSIIKTFVWDGRASNEMPTLNFGPVNYLPSLRAAWTPFGIEYHFENYLRYKNMISLIDLSYGDQTFFDSWGGMGVFIQNIYEQKKISFDIYINIWNQPEIQFGQNPTLYKGGGIGGAFSVRGYYDIHNSEFPISAVLELGYKSPGFLEGYNLDSSPILKIGFALRN